MGPNTRYLYEKIRRYGLDKHSDLARNVLALIELGLMTEDLAAGYLLIIGPMIAQAERYPNYLERPPDRSEIYPNGLPPLVIGACREGEKVPVGLFLYGAVHAIFGGTTGAGKTVGIRRLLKAVGKYNQTHDDQIIVICLDQKNDYTDLFTILGQDCAQFDVHGDLRVGLQHPAGLPVNVWVNHISTLFAARAGLIASSVTLADLMNWLVGVMNPRPSDRILYPDFQLLLDVAERLPKLAAASKGIYQEALVQMLRAVVLAMGSLFSTFNGLDVERDLINKGRSAVICMANLEPPWLSHFFVDLIISQVLIGRVHRGHRVDKLEVLLVLDEADDAASRASEAAFPQGYMSPLARVLRQGREFGIGVVLGLGSLGPVSEHILNSATYHFLFQMSDAKCRRAAADTLQLPAGADALIPKMPPGVCLSRSPAWPDGFMTPPLPSFDRHSPSKSCASVNSAGTGAGTCGRHRRPALWRQSQPPRQDADRCSSLAPTGLHPRNQTKDEWGLDVHWPAARPSAAILTVGGTGPSGPQSEGICFLRQTRRCPHMHRRLAVGSCPARPSPRHQSRFPGTKGERP